ncbi:unnamed protein product [Acanthosepion pharaonis]|uniref:Uncharacterized protein n=1 Tax=Acanthosepion pharaonis TaxID=158019 RepID=A0A812CLS9_ACAPH|nr:unnamed protein product [Sepia pharaonis]
MFGFLDTSCRPDNDVLRHFYSLHLTFFLCLTATIPLFHSLLFFLFLSISLTLSPSLSLLISLYLSSTPSHFFLYLSILLPLFHSLFLSPSFYSIPFHFFSILSSFSLTLLPFHFYSLSFTSYFSLSHSPTISLFISLPHHHHHSLLLPATFSLSLPLSPFFTLSFTPYFSLSPSLSFTESLPLTDSFSLSFTPLLLEFALKGLGRSLKEVCTCVKPGGKRNLVYSQSLKALELLWLSTDLPVKV